MPPTKKKKNRSESTMWIHYINIMLKKKHRKFRNRPNLEKSSEKIEM